MLERQKKVAIVVKVEVISKILLDLGLITLQVVFANIESSKLIFAMGKRSVRDVGSNLSNCDNDKIDEVQRLPRLSCATGVGACVLILVRLGDDGDTPSPL